MWNIDNAVWRNVSKKSCSFSWLKCRKGMLQFPINVFWGEKQGNRLILIQNIIFNIFMLEIGKKCFVNVEVSFWNSLFLKELLYDS